MRKKPHIAIVYTHFPHYRQAVFKEMSRSQDYEFSFFYDPNGIADTIKSGDSCENHFDVKTWKLGPLFFQFRILRLVMFGQFDGFIFLGNPYILTNWPATILARLRGRPVFFWSHGWLRHENGIKARLRRTYYNLANGLLVYGKRAKEIGVLEGYSSKRIHVIYNSLDYVKQQQTRELILANLGEHKGSDDEQPHKPFFLCVARLVPSVELEKAISALAQMQKDAALVVIGAGPEQEALKSFALSLKVDVRFLGPIYDEARLARWFLGTCAVVSPGKVGLLALHAMAYGAPIITHDDLDRQMPEVEAIDPEVTGAFFKRGDVVDLAKHMAVFLERSTENLLADSRRTAAISMIEGNYTPQAQVAEITVALDTAFKKD